MNVRTRSVCHLGGLRPDVKPNESSGPVLDREAIAIACHAHGVQRLRLLGSATSDHFNPSHSDVGVLCWLAVAGEAIN